MRAILLVAAIGCAHRSPAATVPTCGPGWSPLSVREAAPAIDRAPADTVIAAVRIDGITPALADTLHRVVETRAGQRIADAPLAADLRRLWGLGVISDARVELAGNEVAFVVTPRVRVGRVVIRGRPLLELRRFPLLAGAPYEPARVTRIAAAVELGFVRDGHLDAKVSVERAPARNAVDLCVAASPGPRVTIRSMRFPGRRVLPEALLVDAIHGEKAGVNHVGGIYDAPALSSDQVFMMLAYYDHGMVNAQIGAPRAHRHGTAIDIEIPIDEGPVFRLGRVTITGARGLEHGLGHREVFSRTRVAAVRDRIAAATGADVEIATAIDLARTEINLTFDVRWRWPWDALRSWSSSVR